MRLGISRHSHARPAPRRSAVRAFIALAGGAFLVVALSGAAGAGGTGSPGTARPPGALGAAALPRMAALPRVAGVPRTDTAPDYVALGDSYTSGPLIPDPAGDPAGCLRSTHSYPFLVAAATGAATFTDVSCRGATTADMTRSQSVQLGTNPPQDSALSARTTLVTLQISGNDIDFLGIIEHCTTLSLTDPFGSPCKEHYTSGGTDRLRAAIAAAAPKVAADLRGIHAGAPNARVLLVGYPVILPNSGDGCWPLVPIAYGDVPYLRGVEKVLNSMLAAEAAANNATFVDTYTASIGHDACQPTGTKWVEGLIPTSLAAPFHPNRLGEQEMARQVLAALG
jgi:lysophospholipase L1-like esterase